MGAKSSNTWPRAKGAPRYVYMSKTNNGQYGNSKLHQSPPNQRDSPRRDNYDSKRSNRGMNYKSPILWIGVALILVVVLLFAVANNKPDVESNDTKSGEKFAISFSPSTVIGGDVTTGTISIPSNIQPYTQIKIKSNNGVFIVPSIKPYISGREITFTAKTAPTDNEVLADVTATFGDNAGNGASNQSVTTQVKVIPLETGSASRPSITFHGKTSVGVGESLVGYVKLPSVAKKDVPVTLRSDKNGIILTPPTLNVTAGKDNASFTIIVKSDFDGKDFSISTDIDKVKVESERITVASASSADVNWPLGLSITALIIGIGSILYSVLSLHLYRKSAAHDTARYVDEVIDARLKDIKQEQSTRALNGASNPFGYPKAANEDFISREQFNARIVALNDFLQTTHNNNLQLKTQIDELRRSVSAIKDQFSDHTPAPVERSHTQVVSTVESEPVSFLGVDEELKLIEIQDILMQHNAWYGRVKVATNHWSTFSPELRTRILELLVYPGVKIIEPKPGDPVNESLMDIGLVPQNYQMRVRDVLTLGFYIDSTGDCYPAKVIVE